MRTPFDCSWRTNCLMARRFLGMPFVVVVVIELGGRVGLVGEFEGLLDIVVADGGVPGLAPLAGLPDGATAELSIVVDRLVDNVPALDPALVAANDVLDVILMRASAVSRSSGLPARPSKAHGGV